MHWRDNVMLAGLILDIIALVYAIFIESTFFIFVTVVLAVILVFAMYYVSRYAEQRTMEELNGALNQNVQRLTQQNERQAQQNERQAEISRQAQAQIEALEAQNRQLSASCQSLSEEYQNFRNGNELLAITQKQLQSTTTQLTEATMQLAARQRDFAELLRRQNEVQAEVRREVEHLTAIRRDIQGEVGRLRGAGDQILKNTTEQSRMLTQNRSSSDNTCEKIV